MNNVRLQLGLSFLCRFAKYVHGTGAAQSETRNNAGPLNLSLHYSAVQKEVFSCLSVGTWDLALTGIHIKPDSAVAEIDYLHDVYVDLKKEWPAVQVYRHIVKLQKYLTNLQVACVFTVSVDHTI